MPCNMAESVVQSFIAKDNRMPAQIDQQTVREILALAVSKNISIQQAIASYAEPINDQEKSVLLSITDTELNGLRDIEQKLKAVHQTTRSVWAGAIW